MSSGIHLFILTWSSHTELLWHDIHILTTYQSIFTCHFFWCSIAIHPVTMLHCKHEKAVNRIKGRKDWVVSVNVNSSCSFKLFLQNYQHGSFAQIGPDPQELGFSTTFKRSSTVLLFILFYSLSCCPNSREKENICVSMNIYLYIFNILYVSL